MAYGETKVYFDGSHYIAIPKTSRPSVKKKVLSGNIKENKLKNDQRIRRKRFNKSKRIIKKL